MVYKEKLTDLLNNFNPVTLEELEKKELLNRKDLKFLFPDYILPELLEELIDYQNVLDINGNRIFNYSNNYFDTAEHELYRLHHNGKLNRLKFRTRHYCEKNTNFFEIKTKTNKSKTEKIRFESDEFDCELTKDCEDFIFANTSYNPVSLTSILSINYRRITLSHKNNPEKITFDFDIRASNHHITEQLNGIVIAEIKQDSNIKHSEFIEIMKELHNHPRAISKYCICSILIFPELKYNRFKNLMKKINNIRENNG